MSLTVVAYTPEHAALWDAWCANAGNATFLHSRKFLSYHDYRFDDCSVLFFDSGQLVGVMPAARDQHDPHRVVSHPGATYGGIVHQGWLLGARIIEAFYLLKLHYQNLGYTKLLYKPLPYIYAQTPSQDDLYALFRHGAQRLRCDLSSTIDLSARRVVSERRQRGLKKSIKLVALTADNALLDSFWGVLTDNLARKHDAEPVHTRNELAILIARFPEQIQLRCATIKGCVEAGVILFNSTNVWHAQYIAASEKGYAASALDAIFAAILDEAKIAGARYFDFGISNEAGGWVLNEGLYRFKSEFGGGGVVYDFFELDLGGEQSAA